MVRLASPIATDPNPGLSELWPLLLVAGCKAAHPVSVLSPSSSLLALETSLGPLSSTAYRTMSPRFHTCVIALRDFPCHYAGLPTYKG